jgi:hypothetical protein
LDATICIQVGLSGCTIEYVNPLGVA